MLKKCDLEEAKSVTASKSYLKETIFAANSNEQPSLSPNTGSV
jgi:hypothetical protein